MRHTPLMPHSLLTKLGGRSHMMASEFSLMPNPLTPLITYAVLTSDETKSI